jgi:hypothetical protein
MLIKPAAEAALTALLVASVCSVAGAKGFCIPDSTEPVPVRALPAKGIYYPSRCDAMLHQMLSYAKMVSADSTCAGFVSFFVSRYRNEIYVHVSDGTIGGGFESKAQLIVRFSVSPDGQLLNQTSLRNAELRVCFSMDKPGLSVQYALQVYPESRAAPPTQGEVSSQVTAMNRLSKTYASAEDFVGRVLLEGEYRSRKKTSGSSWAQLEFLPEGELVITLASGQRLAMIYDVESDEYCKEYGNNADYVHLEHPVYGTKPFAFKRTRGGLTLQAARLFAVDAQCRYALTPDKGAPVLLFDKSN